MDPLVDVVLVHSCHICKSNPIKREETQNAEPHRSSFLLRPHPQARLLTLDLHLRADDAITNATAALLNDLAKERKESGQNTDNAIILIVEGPRSTLVSRALQVAVTRSGAGLTGADRNPICENIYGILQISPYRTWHRLVLNACLALGQIICYAAFRHYEIYCSTEDVCDDYECPEVGDSNFDLALAVITHPIIIRMLCILVFWVAMAALQYRDNKHALLVWSWLLIFGAYGGQWASEGFAPMKMTHAAPTSLRLLGISMAIISGWGLYWVWGGWLPQRLDGTLRRWAQDACTRPQTRFRRLRFQPMQ
ncbi:hypothetical protein BU16DRAFT_544900 [Lophium mytilinum]|uniref:Uncharacterized protein n=1 Tax=Lophium mytilinum TaxID=390894 RepID=A0A6A6QBS2_9PEZI|nr:hypothetical protein BU16DRAFT_544900 [Lophium mytilinum]